uniref:Uncharacterized protein LOC114348870 n=1 Tax=Diabrotica virgifera virgifera TaxID=50390 RepID=A0A6P7HHL2_DIAVI
SRHFCISILSEEKASRDDLYCVVIQTINFRYSPPITSEHHTCVGLAFELWNRLRLNLDSKYPGIGNHICVVSCEEEIDSPIVYTNAFRYDPTSLPYRLEKEHVMMCLKVEFSGRTAVMLCDPGYHVARVVTVMSDGAYPHTGIVFY